MFTGIVEGQGAIASVSRDAQGMRVVVRHALDGGVARLRRGDSVAVDGVCLTVAERGGADGMKSFSADIGPETQRRTTLADLREGQEVHLEAALRAGDPLGGHLVSGHVDGVGAVLECAAKPDHAVLRVEADGSLARFLAPRGSICVDGMSLTVAEADGGSFAVMRVPRTRAVTHAGRYRPGSRVNIEVDLLARYLERLLQERAAP